MKKYKANQKLFHTSSSSFEPDDESKDKPSKARVKAERDILLIPVRGLLLHLSVSDLERITTSAMEARVDQSISVSTYVQYCAKFCAYARRNLFLRRYE